VKNKELKIGVTGYSAQKFDIPEAQRMLKEAYNHFNSQYPDRPKAIISGLTDLGIPALAHREAVARGWRTIGIACSKASEYECFPVDEKIIEGEDWGQESPKFLETLEVLVRIGGGGQAKRETAEAKLKGKPVIEYDLPAL